MMLDDPSQPINETQRKSMYEWFNSITFPPSALHLEETSDETTVYFAASIRGDESNVPLRSTAIVAALREAGYKVLTGVGLTYHKDSVPTDEQIYERDVNWIIDSDVLIADVTEPSHGVGYEIHVAETWAMPVLCLARRDTRVSAMLTGNPEIDLEYYDSTEHAIKQALSWLDGVKDV